MSTNGIIIINKPAKMTSFDVIAIARKLLQERRIGHAGTLDPDATGVLPLCVGKATGAVEFLMEKDKKYHVTMTLGIKTDTGDSSGQILQTSEVNVTSQQIAEAVLSFLGKNSQTPPMYSAVKVGGRKLYELARKGLEVEREPREIEIYHIEMGAIRGEMVDFEVHCSKGTYIRTLCEDIGEKLGCGAHMSGLVRTAAGMFRLEEAVTPEALREIVLQGGLHRAVIPVDRVFQGFPSLTISGEEQARYMNGVQIPLDNTQLPAPVSREREPTGILVRVYSGDLFLGLGSIIIKNAEASLKTKKFFV